MGRKAKHTVYLTNNGRINYMTDLNTGQTHINKSRHNTYSALVSSRTSQSILEDPQHSHDLLHSDIKTLIDGYWSYRDQIESGLSSGPFIRFEALIAITFTGIRRLVLCGNGATYQITSLASHSGSWSESILMLGADGCEWP